jgi:hypothetical protein
VFAYGPNTHCALRACAASASGMRPSLTCGFPSCRHSERVSEREERERERLGLRRCECYQLAS